jgi:hypothetical protein
MSRIQQTFDISPVEFPHGSVVGLSEIVLHMLPSVPVNPRNQVSVGFFGDLFFDVPLFMFRRIADTTNSYRLRFNPDAAPYTTKMKCERVLITLNQGIFVRTPKYVTAHETREDIESEFCVVAVNAVWKHDER